MFSHVFEAFFLLEALVAIMFVALTAGVLSILVSYAAAYNARMGLMRGALEVACSTLDAVVYGHAPLTANQQGDYAVTLLSTPNQYTQEAVMVRVTWLYNGINESI